MEMLCSERVVEAKGVGWEDWDRAWAVEVDLEAAAETAAAEMEPAAAEEEAMGSERMQCESQSIRPKVSRSLSTYALHALLPHIAFQARCHR